MSDPDYLQSTEDWRASLEADAKREDGPLALVGLFWLKSGVSTVGSSRDCTFCLPKPAPRLIGAFECDGPEIRFRSDIGQVAEVDGIRVEPATSAILRTDPAPSKITLGTISIIPNRFGSKLGIQVWDRSRPALVSQPVRTWFPIDDRLVLRATYTPYPAPVKLTMQDNLGSVQYGYAQGYVAFRLDGKTYNLDATETDDGRLLLQFRDLSNGTRTYAEGRLLHTEVVSEDGDVLIDFNRAFNPVAAFTPFMPSALPPKNHLLNCAVDAGECTPSIPPEWTT